MFNFISLVLSAIFTVNEEEMNKLASKIDELIDSEYLLTRWSFNDELRAKWKEINGFDYTPYKPILSADLSVQPSDYKPIIDVVKKTMQINEPIACSRQGRYIVVLYKLSNTMITIDEFTIYKSSKDQLINNKLCEVPYDLLKIMDKIKSFSLMVKSIRDDFDYEAEVLGKIYHFTVRSLNAKSCTERKLVVYHNGINPVSDTRFAELFENFSGFSDNFMGFDFADEDCILINSHPQTTRCFVTHAYDELSDGYHHDLMDAFYDE